MRVHTIMQRTNDISDVKHSPIGFGKPIEKDTLAVTSSNERINPEQAFPRRLKGRKCDIPKDFSSFATAP